MTGKSLRSTGLACSCASAARAGAFALLMGTLASSASGETGTDAFCRSVLELGSPQTLKPDLGTAGTAQPADWSWIAPETPGRFEDLLPQQGVIANLGSVPQVGAWIDREPITQGGDVHIVPLPGAAWAGMGLLTGCLGVRALRSIKR